MGDVWRKKRRGRKKRVPFDPNHQYVANAIEEFLKGGGKITKIEVSDKMCSVFVKISDSTADDFLNGK